jgi:hypothetical protein
VRTELNLGLAASCSPLLPFAVSCYNRRNEVTAVPAVAYCHFSAVPTMKCVEGPIYIRYRKILLLGMTLASSVIGLELNAQVQRQTSTLTAAATPGKLQGRVINAVTGLPIPRVLIRMNSRAVLTDHEGKFFFDQVAETAANLQISKPGFYTSADPADSPNMFYQLDQLIGPVELRLFPESLLTGTVTAPDGEPLARIGVQARRSTFDEQGQRWVPAGQSLTDLHGNFRIPVSAGSYRIESRYIPRNSGERDAVLPVSVPALATNSQAIHIGSGEEQHFDLRPMVRRTFPVLLRIESGSARGFPQITAHTSDGNSFNLGVGPTRTPGRANLYLPTGTYRLTARIQSPDAVETADTSVTVTGAEQLVADSDMSPTAGTVLRFTKTAAIPVEMSLDSGSTSDNSSQSASASSTSAQPRQAQGSTVGTSTTGPNLMQFGLSLQRLDQPDEEVAGNVSLVTPRNGTAAFSAPPGTYRLSSGGFGAWYIRSATYGSSDLIGHTLTVAAGSGGSTIHLLASNQTGSLQGSVKLKGQAASGCWVYLINDSPSITPVYTFRSSTADGTFSDPYVPPGTYQIVAFERRHSADFTDPGAIAPFSSWTQSVTITAGGQSTTNLNAVPQTEVRP